jgi:hypothetical protein
MQTQAMKYYTHRSQFLFAPEIEEATVSMCWRDPVLFEQLWLRGNPEEFFGQRHCLEIMRAMKQCHEVVGALDFAMVVQCVRDRGMLEECGGVGELDRIYKMAEFTPYTERVFYHHLERLDEYVRLRNGTLKHSRVLEPARRMALERQIRRVDDVIQQVRDR